MAVDLHMLEMEASHEGRDGNRTEPEPPATTTPSGGDAAETAVVYKKGAWSKEEDDKLRRAVDKYGLRNWVAIEKFSGLGRPAKNCRLRWLNYLRPNLKKYPFTQEEEELIFQLHSKYGNSWSRIASKLPGRSDNEIKNFWHKRSNKRHKHHLPIYPTTTTVENHTNLPNNYEEANNAKDEYLSKNDDVPTNYYPNHTLPSTSTHSQELLQPSTLIVPKMAISTPPSSAPQMQFLSSPASSHAQQSPDQNTLLLPTTPTSQTQNLLITPNPRNPSLLIPDISRKPPILSSPRGPLRRFSRATSELSPSSAHYSVVSNASPLLPRDSSSLQMQMQFSSAMESPRSPLKLNLSPSIPAQMNTQTTDSQVASFSAFQLQSPNTAPLSPLKLRLSIPMPSEFCFQSNLSIPDSTVRLGSLSSPELKPSSCGQDLPTIQPMTADTTDDIIPHDSSQPIKTGRPSIQVESDDSSFEIMKELREAQTKVRFLKKKLRLRRISNKRSLLKGSSETTDLMEVSSESTTEECMLHTSSGTKNFLDDISRVKTPLQNSRKKDVLKTITQRKGDMITSATEENRLCKLQTRENSESQKYTHESIESEKATREREDYSLSEIFKRENSMTFQEQRHSIDFFDHLNIQNTVNALNSDSFDNKLCHFQGPEGKCLNECSSIDGLYSESSTLLQDSTLQGDMFGQRSGTQDQLSSQRLYVPHRDAFGPVYSQSTATTLVKPDDDEIGRLNYLQPDQGGYFGYGCGQEISNSLERKLTEDGLIDGNESNLLLNQYPAAAESSCLVSASIMEHEYFQGEQLSLQTTPGGGDSAETWRLCEPTMLTRHQSPAANLIDNLVDSRYLVGFEQECPQGEQYFLQEFDRSECASRETWKQEPSREQSLMQGLMVDKLWPQGQVVSQDQIFSTNGFHSGVDLMESKNWNDESGCGHTWEVIKHEVEHDHMNTMSEELSSLLEFFPTTNQTLEWYNIGNAIPDSKASNEFDMSSTSQPLLTTADYL